MGAGVLEVNAVTITEATSAGLWPQGRPVLDLPFLFVQAFVEHLQPLTRLSHMISYTHIHAG